MITGLIIKTLISLLRIYNYLILGRVLLSWFRSESLIKIYIFFHNITEPVLGPIRRIMPDTGGWDFSPVIAFILIDILIRFLSSIL